MRDFYKWLLFIFLPFFSFVSHLHAQSLQQGGVYQYGTTADKGSFGVLYVHPETDSTSLFYLEMNMGAPSFNSGAMIGLMKYYDFSTAYFTIKNDDENINCSINFQFISDSVYVRSDNVDYQCGFGHGVYPYGIFQCIDHEVPDFFIDRIGEKVMFENLNWLEWW